MHVLAILANDRILQEQVVEQGQFSQRFASTLPLSSLAHPPIELCLQTYRAENNTQLISSSAHGIGELNRQAGH